MPSPINDPELQREYNSLVRGVREYMNYLRGVTLDGMQERDMSADAVFSFAAMISPLAQNHSRVLLDAEEGIKNALDTILAEVDTIQEIVDEIDDVFGGQ